MNPLFTTPITSTADAEGFLFQLHDMGLSFHPDDAPASIVDAQGQPVFTDAQAQAIADRMEEVFFWMVDPCEYLLNLIHSTDRS